MSAFLKALLFTAMPMLVWSAVGVALTRPRFGFAVSIAGVGAVAFVVAILISVGFAVARKRQIALGILAGAAIGLVGLGLTCFAPLWT